MEEDSVQQRQFHELEAIKAIFPDQFVNCNEDCSAWKPLNIIITVFPQREHSGPLEVHVKLDLHIIASEEYPNKVPNIMLEKSKGLSDKQLAEIQKSLEELASSKVGEVMILDLVYHIQPILTESNKPAFQSCYEEMLSRQEKQKQKEVERQETEENIERQITALEVKGIKKKRQRKKRGPANKLGEIVENDISPTHSLNRKCSVEEVKLRNYEDTKVDIKQIENTLYSLNSNSHLLKEFELLDFIGRGAYGDVLKVRSKLDGGLYAIKQIKLYQKKKQINKKITREVKLLSRLNHENVVRYYCSWLEDLEQPEQKSHKELKKGVEKYNEKSSLENLNLSFPCPNKNPSFSDEDDDDDNDNDWIEFKNDENVVISTDTVDAVIQKIDESHERRFPNQCMYIQMEYCEKSTLRSAIDDNLFKDENRVWRLLREVVEGLSYIHQQGIIHRDLKPVNIFIDSNDRVKIGDFGLATPNKPSTIRNETNLNQSNRNSCIVESADASYTGQVGTALYVAPELNTCDSYVHYNQKVDIYSLGIIFFEMCYRPFNTEMERIKVLSDLRLDSRNFPNEFYKSQLTRQLKLIRELLNHNPTERPSAAEILEKQYIPLAELENEKLHETIHHTLCNPQSKMYKHLIAECFSQKVSVAEDIAFDKVSSDVKTAWWQHAFIEKMADNARKIFRLHGGTNFSTPLLSPQNMISIKDTGAVCLMTRSGSLVTIPYDLRLSFARYLAQNPSVTHMKRYTVDKIFRERRMLGTRPKEIFECAFDIVSPSSCNLTLEAEVLSIVCEFLDSFSENLQKNCVICLNHVSLVSAILFHHHIVAKKHLAICHLLQKTKFPKVGNPLTNLDEFQNFSISETSTMNLIHALNVEITPAKMNSHFSYLTKNSSTSSSYCKQAIAHLKILVQHLTSLQIKCSIVIAPSVISNFHYYSGIMFQVVWERKNKNRLEKDIIAVGGRYDNLIAHYRKALNKVNDSKQSLVGLSIFLDKLISSSQIDCQFFSTVDVLVCSVGKSDMAEEKLKIMKDLCSAEIRCTILHAEQSLEETQNYCEKMKIPYIVFIKESEPGLARLRSWFKDRFCEKMLSLTEIVPHLQRTIRQNNNNAGVEIIPHNADYHHSRSQSRSASNNTSENRSINIRFFFDEKLNNNNKRRCENQVSNCITNSLYKISSTVKIEVIVVNAEYEFVKALVSAIDLNTKDNSCFMSLFKIFPRLKNCLNRIADYLEELQLCNPVPVIVFFSLPDNNFKVLV